MRRTLLRITEAALLAALLLTPPAAFAQDRSPSSVVADTGGAFSFVWSLLEALLPGGVIPDTRCTIDPDGGISCPESGATLDNRCTIDPDGRASCEPSF